MNNEIKHSFFKRFSKKSFVENLILNTLRIATYFIIIFAGYIFLDIGINGSKAVFKAEAPFINIDFLTQKPQTLHVYEPKVEYTKIKSIDAEVLKLELEKNRLGRGEIEKSKEIQNSIKEKLKTKELLKDIIRDKRFKFSDTEYRALNDKPSTDEFVYETYAYSGGGIGPAIVGTCLLVIGSIAIALSLGVLCAIFLSEYSRPGKTTQIIRLSILNLSGVPSIVFGLFGFGMFVLFLDGGFLCLLVGSPWQ